MAKSQEFTAGLKDFMGLFPVDAKAFENAFKSTVSLNEKLSGVALGAVEKSAEVSNRWTKDTLGKMGEMSKAGTEPVDYAKAVTDFASVSAETAVENIAAFSDIVKKAQTETVELLMESGKNAAREATTAVRKTAGKVTVARKKAAAAN